MPTLTLQLSWNPFAAIPVVSVEDPGASLWVKTEQTLTAQQVNSLATVVVCVFAQTSVVTQEADSVTQGQSVVKVASRLTLSI